MSHRPDDELAPPQIEEVEIHQRSRCESTETVLDEDLDVMLQRVSTRMADLCSRMIGPIPNEFSEMEFLGSAAFQNAWSIPGGMQDSTSTTSSSEMRSSLESSTNAAISGKKSSKTPTTSKELAFDIERSLEEMQRILEDCAMEDFETAAREIARRRWPVKVPSIASQMGCLQVEMEKFDSELDGEARKKMNQLTTTARMDMAIQTDEDKADASTQTEESDPTIHDCSVGPSEASVCLADIVPSFTPAQLASPAIIKSPCGGETSSTHPQMASKLPMQSKSQIRSPYGSRRMLRYTERTALPPVPELSHEPPVSASSAVKAEQQNSQAQSQTPFKITEDTRVLCQEQPIEKKSAKILAAPSMASWTKGEEHADPAAGLSAKIIEQMEQVRRLRSLVAVRDGLIIPREEIAPCQRSSPSVEPP